MKVLVVGDPHAKVEDLEDCRRLHELVLQVCREQKPKMVVYVGDEFDSHAVKNVEVEKFWMQSFLSIPADIEVYVIVGNHDRPGNAASDAHSLQTFKSYVKVVDKPFLRGKILMLPYYHDPKKLVSAAKEYEKTTLLFCHAAFSGGHYDNGMPIKADAFYGKDVVNPDDIPQKWIISGHIHTPYEFGKVNYVGSPRWQTMGDANVERFLNVIEVDEETGSYVMVSKVPTGEVCRRSWKLEFSPTDDCSKELALVRPGDKVMVNVRGPIAFCEDAKKELQGKSFRVGVFPTDRGVAKVSEAEGVPVAFRKHVDGYKAKYGTSKEVLKNMLKERLNVGA